ncbi:bacterial alpha-L-rhamnosidase-domain-containing protein [Xylariales sp. PMI_506]|nr:bacterial alpha-L-rhamnosidase-domain-containing protein [Xylariales sp. PMI_506]
MNGINEQAAAPIGVKPIKLRFEHHRSAFGVGEARPRISWKFEGNLPGWKQAEYELEVTRPSITEPEIYRVISPESVLIPWPSTSLVSADSASVRVRAFPEHGAPTPWSDSATVEAGLLYPEDWMCALIRSPDESEKESPHRPVLFRREFQVSSNLLKARLYITAHGVYESEINGVPVGDHVLAPGWTSYQHELPYQTFDVTNHLKTGANVLGAHVGEGRFAGRLGFMGGQRNIWGSQLGVIAQLVLTYVDGRSETIPTDDKWKCNIGAVISSEIYDGEYYDARLQLLDWSTPGQNDSAWRDVVTATHDPKLLRAPDGPPIRRIQELPALKAWKSPKQKWIIDFGQNLVGWLRVRVKGPSGHTIRLTHTEVLEHGEVATRPLRQAKAADTIIVSGEPMVWEPHFTFHGFRYVQVEQWPEAEAEGNALNLDNFTAVVIHTDIERSGWFECSEPLINKLHENVVWSMKGNFVGVPTDCPQRDERLGWTGDLQAFAPTACFLYDVHGMLKTWLRGLAAEQREDEARVPPLFSPNTFRDRPRKSFAIWGDTVVMVPWDMHQSSGDVDILREQYSSMVDWVEKGVIRDSRKLWDSEKAFQLGDWLDPDAPPDEPSKGLTDAHLVANSFLIRTTELMSNISSILGLEAARRQYREDAEALRQEFGNEYITASGRVVSDTQTALALALHFSLFSTTEQEKCAVKRLTQLILGKSRFKISSGFAGTPILGHALTKFGHSQLFYRMLFHRKCPSWLYPVTMGATTVWERWNSMLPDGTINPGEMTSFNHYALGSVAHWMHKVIGGLWPVQPGWKKFMIMPIPGGPITSANIRFDSPYGIIEVKWELKDGNMYLQARVPPSTTATIVLPGQAAREVFSGLHEIQVPYNPPHWPPLPVYPPHAPHDDDEP